MNDALHSINEIFIRNSSLLRNFCESIFTNRWRKFRQGWYEKTGKSKGKNLVNSRPQTNLNSTAIFPPKIYLFTGRILKTLLFFSYPLSFFSLEIRTEEQKESTLCFWGKSSHVVCRPRVLTLEEKGGRERGEGWEECVSPVRRQARSNPKDTLTQRGIGCRGRGWGRLRQEETVAK